MRINKKTMRFILASLLVVILGITGCSSAPYHEQSPEKKSEPASDRIEKGVVVPKQEGDNDDMERLE